MFLGIKAVYDWILILLSAFNAWILQIRMPQEVLNYQTFALGSSLYYDAIWYLNSGHTLWSLLVPLMCSWGKFQIEPLLSNLIKTKFNWQRIHPSHPWSGLLHFAVQDLSMEWSNLSNYILSGCQHGQNHEHNDFSPCETIPLLKCQRLFSP